MHEKGKVHRACKSIFEIELRRNQSFESSKSYRFIKPKITFLYKTVVLGGNLEHWNN